MDRHRKDGEREWNQRSDGDSVVACRDGIGAVYGNVNKLESSVIPLLASPQGGVAASSRKFRAATEADAAGVVFHLFSSENHPGLAVSGGFAIIFDRSATPPCGDARRGNRPFQFIHRFQFIHSSIDRLYSEMFKFGTTCHPFWICIPDTSFRRHLLPPPGEFHASPGTPSGRGSFPAGDVESHLFAGRLH